jgi:hypothetical protein
MPTVISKYNHHCLVLILLAFELTLGIALADTPQIVNCDGYPCVNFSFGANVSRHGKVFRSLFFNRPQLGEGLDPLGGGQFHFAVDGESHTASDCAAPEVTRLWPIASVHLKHADWKDVTFSMRVLVPNGLDDGFTGTRPVAMADITVTNPTSVPHECSVRFDSLDFFKAGLRDLNTEKVTGIMAEENFVAWVLPVNAVSDKASITILPVIEREDDIDINCFFILRALRYVRFHKDNEFGQKVLPALLHAADWLAYRDVENTGLPQAASYWYDWKDVSGVTGRKYSPYASMLYVAATEQLASYCKKLGHPEKATELGTLSKMAKDLLNRSVSRGGLWNGRYYQQVWKDGRNSTNLLEDQVVGIVFSVVDDDKAKGILTSLESKPAPGALERLIRIIQTALAIGEEITTMAESSRGSITPMPGPCSNSAAIQRPSTC